jgi:UPF0755 protein
MKLLFKFLLGLFVYTSTFAVICAVIIFWRAKEEFVAPGPHQEMVTLSIPKGAGIGGVSEILRYHGVLENTPEMILFKNMGRLTGQHKNLKAGEYEIPPKASMKQVLRLLEDGKAIQRRFTVREGLTSYEIVRMINAVDGLSGDITAVPLEGSLLPETYDYQKGDTRQKALARMEEGMTQTILTACDILLEEIADTPFTAKMNMACGPAPKPLKNVRDVLTLASIVEKETAVPSERARVAGVFFNRLNKGIALQTDPTVIYALTLGKHKNDGKGPLGRRLLRKDLSVESPYNTYKYPGLPPGPIANPGRAAIEAVINPETHSYIYFVADGSGGHAFAKTLKEHNANVTKWRKIRKNQLK